MTETGYTGLDLQAAYRAVFPATASTVRFQDVNDRSQNLVKRVARAIATARAEERNENAAILPLPVHEIRLPAVHGPLHDWFIIPDWAHTQAHVEGVEHFHRHHDHVGDEHRPKPTEEAAR